MAAKTYFITRVFDSLEPIFYFTLRGTNLQLWFCNMRWKYISPSFGRTQSRFISIYFKPVLYRIERLAEQAILYLETKQRECISIFFAFCSVYQKCEMFKNNT